MLPPDTKGLVDIHPSIWHLFFLRRVRLFDTPVCHMIEVYHRGSYINTIGVGGTVQF